MQPNKLNAYLVGAGVGGTIIVMPYIVRTFWSRSFPELFEIYQPFYLIPIIWGLWNLLHASFNRPPIIGVWGAILGFILGLVINLLIYAGGYWVKAAILIPVFASALYFLLWHLIVGTLNHTLGVDR